MTSLILRTMTRLLLPLLLMFSVFLLLRGHNEPGGGFVGGLMAATGFALISIAFGSETARRILLIDPYLLVGMGLLIALLSGLVPLGTDQPLMTAIWSKVNLGALGKIELGTPLFFDIGVYLVVWGVTLTIIFALEEVS
ncbi:MAG: Na+/H+ antiporter subunit B [Anaerolineales bacterium]